MYIDSMDGLVYRSIGLSMDGDWSKAHVTFSGLSVCNLCASLLLFVCLAVFLAVQLLTQAIASLSISLSHSHTSCHNQTQQQQNGIWCNSGDQAGYIMSAMVWILMIYSAFTVTALTITEGIPVTLGMIYNTLVCMALASHAKTSLTDPGSVPLQAIPSERQRMLRDSHSMCGQCQTFKPPNSHHCRICNRCISRMDHHCPWMNNCVGVGNLKHFILFLIYTWTAAAYALAVFGWNYFFCADEECTFHPVVLHLVRLMTLLAVGAWLFTSSMLMNVCYGIMTGIGTIDRLKKKATNTMSQSDEEPIQLIDVRIYIYIY